MTNLDYRVCGDAQKPLADAMILCPHSDDGATFMEEFPAVLDGIQVSEERFRQYLRIEQDFGSHELGIATAEGIAQQTQNIARVDVVGINVPRGILDMNRTKRTALRNVIDYQRVPDLKTELLLLYQETALEIRNSIQDALRANGILLHMHTMAPFSPLGIRHGDPRPLSITPDTVDTYTDEYMLACDTGHKRETDIAATLCKDQTKIETLADISLVLQMMRAFTRREISFALNRPYTLCPFNMDVAYYRKFPVKGLTLDISKHEVSGLSPEECSTRLDSLPLDISGVTRMAGLIASACANELQSE